MKIIKYVKKGNNNYQIYLDNNEKITINEEIILKHKLLYKKEINEFLLAEIKIENADYDIYNKCVKYIAVRLRSTYEVKAFMEHKNVSPQVIDNTIEMLQKHKLLDDEVFAKAFIKDKFNFTTMGPYRIEMELKKHNIDNCIISKYINELDENLIIEKLNKQINKLLKSNKNKPNLKSKIYNNLVNLGYSSSQILECLNNYEL